MFKHFYTFAAIMLVISVPAFAASEIDIKDEFLTFDTRPSQVAIEDSLENAPWTLWQTGASRTACQDGTIKLDLQGKGELRVICKEALGSAQAGIIEVRVRFFGLGNGNVFLGASSKDPWMRYGVVQMFNHSRSGYFSSERKATPALQDGEWHTFRIEWESGTASLTMDGKILGQSRYETYSSGFYPLLVINSSGKAWTAEIDYFHFSGNRPHRPSASADVQPVSVPVPLLPPALPEPEARPARVSLSAGRLVLENRYFRQEFAWGEKMPIRCLSFMNAFTGRNMLLQPTRFFSVFLGSRQLDDFLVISSAADSHTATLVMRSGEAPVEAVWTASLTEDSPELRTTLTLKNLSDKQVELGSAHPLLLGHRVRTKTSSQILAELDSLYALGWREEVFFVDDNFIGNKKFLKEDLLPALIAWRKHKRGMTFYTEASINLAEDQELMQMMVEAGFNRVFIGIETPDDLCLAECKKIQNKNRDLISDVKRIQQAGLEVQGGFIVGFDHDSPSIFRRQIDFIQQSGIVTAMVGLLQAPPGTRLHERLKLEGRLRGESTGDNVYGSTNILPKMDFAVLLAGYHEILQHIYSPKHYYQRLRTHLRNIGKIRFRTPLNFSGIHALLLSFWRLGFLGRERFQYWRLLFWTLFHRPRLLSQTVTLAIYGYHFRKMCDRHVI